MDDKKWGVGLASTRSEAIFPLQNGRMYAKSWRKAKQYRIQRYEGPGF